MKLKILASFNSISAIFSKKLFYQTFFKVAFALLVMLILEPKPIKSDWLVKLRYQTGPRSAGKKNRAFQIREASVSAAWVYSAFWYGFMSAPAVGKRKRLIVRVGISMNRFNHWRSRLVEERERMNRCNVWSRLLMNKLWFWRTKGCTPWLGISSACSCGAEKPACNLVPAASQSLSCSCREKDESIREHAAGEGWVDF